MTKTEITKNEFFHQFTVQLCSSLDIRKAVQQCSFILKELITYEIINVALFTDQPNTLKYLLNIYADGELEYGEHYTVSDKAWANMQKHLKSDKVLLMYAPENREYAESLTNYSIGILNSYDISMPLVFEGQPLGFFAMRVKEKLTDEQVEIISSIKEPITHAVAAAIKFENEQKQQSQPFPVDIVFNRLKLLGNMNTDKKLAQKLNMHPSNIANCRLRNSIPYDKIIQYCHSESLILDYIFMHEPFVLNKKLKNGFYKVVFTDGIKQLGPAEIEKLLNIPEGELNTYIEVCTGSSHVIPPVGKLHAEILMAFQRALLDKKINRSNLKESCIQISIPIASGALSENREVVKLKQTLCFCKSWIERLNFSENVFAFNITGDIMAPTLLENDIVLIDPDNKNPRTGGLYGISIGGSITIRRLVPTGEDSLATICDNKMYPTGSISHNEIVGKVIWYSRNL